jgi:diguanylate cyclase (GGDEF)-like protein
LSGKAGGGGWNRGQTPAPPPARIPPGRRRKPLYSSRPDPYPGGIGVLRASAWDLAVETVDEVLREGGAPSLARLGRLGQLGTLPSFIAALDAAGDPAELAADYAREREGLGLGQAEVVAELLALGRVLERHGERGSREILDHCLLVYFGQVTGGLAELARRDPLTGLLHHRAFHDLVGRELARAQRYRGRLALVLLDLDHFKVTNDTEGHQEGDRLLRAFGRALAQTVRETDAIGRLGGDEFGALLLQADQSSAGAFLDRLHEGMPAELSVSAGAATLADGCVGPEQLFGLADRRLYESKTARAA